MNSDIPESLRSIEHFLSIRDIDSAVLVELVDFAIRRKQEFFDGKLEPVLRGKVLAMIFQKSSLRTRLGFESAMAQLGGHPVNLEDHQVGLARREALRDVARVISSMCDGIMARVYTHQTVVELAAHSSVPVINGLSDWAHPCQAMADLMTIKEHFGDYQGLTLAYVGDGNNVARSLLNACVKVGTSCTVASPTGYQLDKGLIESARSCATQSGAQILTTADPAEAVEDADIVYTDVWTSMGQEEQRAEREKAFANYQVTADLMKLAKPGAVVMHCLPAHRNEEIAGEVIDGPQSIIFQQAANRLHSQRALLEVLLTRPRKQTS